MADVPTTANIQRLILETARLGSLPAGTMAHGMYDRFTNIAGIDTSSAYKYGTVGGYSWCKAIDSETIGNITAGSAASGGTGDTWIEKQWPIPQGAPITSMGVYCVNTENNIVLGVAYPNGSNFDLVSIATVNKNSAGAQTFNLSSYNYVTTALCYPAMYVPAGTYGDAGANNIVTTGGQWHLIAGNQFGNTNVAFSDNSPYQIRINVTYGPTNMTLISNPIIASGTTTGASGTAMVYSIDPSTKLYVSSAATPDWTELTNLTLTGSNVLGTGIHQYITDYVPFTGSADCSMRWKCTTDYGHGTYLYGVAINWS